MIKHRDDDRLIPVTLEDGTRGYVTLGDVRRAIERNMPRMVTEIYDSSPILRQMLKKAQPSV